MRVDRSKPTRARPPVVQARAVETRRKLLEHAEQAFSERGYDATSLTTDILDPAGVSVGSFYHQFGNKRELLLALIADRIDVRRTVVGGAIATADAASLEEVLRLAFNLLLDDLDTNTRVWMIQFRERENLDPDIRTSITRGFAMWREVAIAVLAHWYPDQPGREQVARVLVQQSTGLARWYLASDATARLETRRSFVAPLASFMAGGAASFLGPPIRQSAPTAG